MKLLPIDFPDLSETPLQRKLRAWTRDWRGKNTPDIED